MSPLLARFAAYYGDSAGTRPVALTVVRDVVGGICGPYERLDAGDNLGPDDLDAILREFGYTRLGSWIVGESGSAFAPIAPVEGWR